MRVVLERLEWRQPSVPVVTVAGTNGKGSVTAYCAQVLAAAGHRVGMFTSPQYGGNYQGSGWKMMGFADQHAFAPPFGYYDREYTGFVPYSGSPTEKRS